MQFSKCYANVARSTGFGHLVGVGVAVANEQLPVKHPCIIACVHAMPAHGVLVMGDGSQLELLIMQRYM